jgi:hypothetical protein
MSDDLNMHYRRNLPKDKSLVFSTTLECIFSCIVVVKSIGGENQAIFSEVESTTVQRKYANTRHFQK